jgi:F-type H+-transporting ATPase subunit epsilon
MSDIPKTLQVRVITPKKVLVNEEGVTALSLPSVDGELGILPGHRSLLTAVGSGTLVIEKGSSARQEHQIHGGTAEIHPDRVRIFTSEGKDPSIPE